MSSPEVGAEVVAAKPCTSCRKRKVKCDRTRPCSNCVRTKQLCTYENVDGGSVTRDGNAGAGAGAGSSSDAELRERLARLEKLMAEMMLVPDTKKPSPDVVANPTPNDPTTTTTSTTTTRPPISPLPPQHSRPQSIPDLISSSSTTSTPVGHLIFQEGEASYFDADFWASLISEIEDLRRIFDSPPVEDTSSQWASLSLLGAFSTFDVALVHPSIKDSDTLCKLFFQTVHPFICVLHQSLFTRELDQYRRGTFIFPQVFEALLFSIYTLTVNSLRAETVEHIFSTSKGVLLARYQYAAQAALTKIDFFKTSKVNGLSALLHYTTFLFQQNLYKDAVALLGVAVRQAQNLGLHHDPEHFPFSPWVCELRRRLWNHVCNLDAWALSSYGVASSLHAATDTAPPHNANDGDWHASRFAKPSSVPQNTIGFKDMTFVLVQREISDLTRALSRLESNGFEAKEKMLNDLDLSLTTRYFSKIDRNNASQAIIGAFARIRLSSLRLTIQYRRSERGKLQPPVPERQQVFIAAIELLEAYEYNAVAFAPLNWEWVFETNIPWLGLAIVLTEISNSSSQQEIDRAHRQIERIFQRYSSTPVSNTPMWKMLIQLRQHMQNDPAHVLATSGGGYQPGNIPAPAAIFADDLMIDFQTGGNEQNPVLFDDQLGDQLIMQDMPWIVPRTQF